MNTFLSGHRQKMANAKRWQSWMWWLPRFQSLIGIFKFICNKDKSQARELHLIEFLRQFASQNVSWSSSSGATAVHFCITETDGGCLAILFAHYSFIPSVAGNLITRAFRTSRSFKWAPARVLHHHTISSTYVHLWYNECSTITRRDIDLLLHMSGRDGTHCDSMLL